MFRMLLNAVIIYVALIVFMRLIGKRQLGELELSELVVMLLISEVASAPITDPAVPVARIMVPVAGLMGLAYILSLLALKSVKFRALLAGKPALLVVHGRLDQSQMRKNRITPDELAEAMRGFGVTDMNTVEYAILETSGKINVIPVPAERTATAGQLGIPADDTGYPMIVINCGRVMTENLRLLGRDERWLMKQLKKSGLESPARVYMMTVDMAGGIFLAPKEP